MNEKYSRRAYGVLPTVNAAAAIICFIDIVAERGVEDVIAFRYFSLGLMISGEPLALLLPLQICRSLLLLSALLVCRGVIDA